MRLNNSSNRAMKPKVAPATKPPTESHILVKSCHEKGINKLNLRRVVNPSVTDEVPLSYCGNMPYIVERTNQRPPLMPKTAGQLPGLSCAVKKSGELNHEIIGRLVSSARNKGANARIIGASEVDYRSQASNRSETECSISPASSCLNSDLRSANTCHENSETRLKCNIFERKLRDFVRPNHSLRDRRSSRASSKQECNSSASYRKENEQAFVEFYNPYSLTTNLNKRSITPNITIRHQKCSDFGDEASIISDQLTLEERFRMALNGCEQRIPTPPTITLDNCKKDKENLTSRQQYILSSRNNLAKRRSVREKHNDSFVLSNQSTEGTLRTLGQRIPKHQGISHNGARTKSLEDQAALKENSNIKPSTIAADPRLQVSNSSTEDFQAEKVLQNKSVKAVMPVTKVKLYYNSEHRKKYGNSPKQSVSKERDTPILDIDRQIQTPISSRNRNLVEKMLFNSLHECELDGWESNSPLKYNRIF